jgi:predicted aspartyl protease
LNGAQWQQNENGVVSMLHNIHKQDQADSDALAKRKTTSKGDITLLGETSTPVRAYVVEIHPKDGRHEWRFYEKATYLLIRMESVTSDGRVTDTYSDFRTIDGITEAWHRHSSDGYAQNDEDWMTTSDRLGATVKPEDVEIPQSNPELVQFPAGVRTVKLPAKIIDGDIVVRLTIAGRGLDFILDSGSSGIALDARTTRELGLQTLGQSVRTTAGTYVQSQALIPSLSIGDIRMKNVVVDSLPFSEDEAMGTKAVGLLGYDFIANAVLAVDYEHGSVEATVPGSFVPPADAFAVDALLDDGVPIVSVQVGEATGNHFIVDTGASRGMIFSSFASAHPTDIVDQGLGRQISQDEPFMSFQGVGGNIKIRPVQVKSVHVGGVSFTDWLMFVSTGNRAFEGEDMDGILGYDFLKYFTVYFDYPDSHIYLMPNSLAKR